MTSVDRALAAVTLLCLILVLPAAEALPQAPRHQIPRPAFPGSNDAKNTTGNATDTAPPAITILSHKDKETVKESGIVLRGSAMDNGSGVRLVQVRLNGRPWAQASGNTSWSIRLSLDEGRNTITVSAADLDGNEANLTIALVLSTGTRNNGGVILAAAVIIPIVALLVLFAMRRRPAPAEPEKGGDEDIGTRLEREAKPAVGRTGEVENDPLENQEEVTHLDKPPARKRIKLDPMKEKK
jgi:hypothetical protein